jgi:hypothetical protein
MSAGVINTPLSKYIMGEGYLGWSLRQVFGILGWFWVKTPAQGASTTITAAVSPNLEDDAGVYILCYLSQ